MNKTSLDAALDLLVRRIVEIARPDRIIVFGSAARGDMGPDSDIDLLVIKTDVEHRGHLAQEIYAHLPSVDIPVDELRKIVAMMDDDSRHRLAGLDILDTPEIRNQLDGLIGER